MTLPERIYALPAAIHASQLRATAGVRSNSDGGPYNAHSALRNQPGLGSGNGGHRLSAHCSLSSQTPAAHLALIEIP